VTQPDNDDSGGGVYIGVINRMNEKKKKKKIENWVNWQSQNMSTAHCHHHHRQLDRFAHFYFIITSLPPFIFLPGHNLCA
jgi:hypothetical protein